MYTYMYKIFDTIEEFNIKNQEINYLLGYPTNDMHKLELTEIINGNDYNLVYKYASQIYDIDYVENSGMFNKVNTDWYTKSSTETYSIPIITSDNKYAMQILSDVIHLFSNEELIENIEFKNE